MNYKDIDNCISVHTNAQYHSVYSKHALQFSFKGTRVVSEVKALWERNQSNGMAGHHPIACDVMTRNL